MSNLIFIGELLDCFEIYIDISFHIKLVADQSDESILVTMVLDFMVPIINDILERFLRKREKNTLEVIS